MQEFSFRSIHESFKSNVVLWKNSTRFWMTEFMISHFHVKGDENKLTCDRQKLPITDNLGTRRDDCQTTGFVMMFFFSVVLAHVKGLLALQGYQANYRLKGQSGQSTLLFQVLRHSREIVSSCCSLTFNMKNGKCEWDDKAAAQRLRKYKGRSDVICHS